MFWGPICLFTVQWRWKKTNKNPTLVVPFPLSALFSSRRLQLWLREILEQLTKRLWTTVVHILLRSGRTMGRKTPHTGSDWINRVISLISWQPICSYFQRQFINLFIYMLRTLLTSPILVYSPCWHARVGNAVFKRKYAKGRCISSKVPCDTASTLQGVVL